MGFSWQAELVMTPPVCRLKTPPCVQSKSHRVCTRGFQRATPHGTHHTTPHTTYNHTQPHTPHHTETETEKEDRERREDESEDKTRQDKMKEEMKEKKTEIMMWTDAESKFAEEKAKQAKLKSARN